MDKSVQKTMDKSVSHSSSAYYSSSSARSHTNRTHSTRFSAVQPPLLGAAHVLSSCACCAEEQR